MSASELWNHPPKGFVVERLGDKVTVIYRDSWASSTKLSAFISWFLSALFCYFAVLSPWLWLIAIPSLLSSVGVLIYLATRVRAIILQPDSARTETRWWGKRFSVKPLGKDITRVRVGKDNDTDLPEYTVDVEGLTFRLTVARGLSKPDALWFGENLASALGVRYLRA